MIKVRFSFTVTIGKEAEAPPAEREVDMGALVETAPQPRYIGFAPEGADD